MISSRFNQIKKFSLAALLIVSTFNSSSTLAQDAEAPKANPANSNKEDPIFPKREIGGEHGLLGAGNAAIGIFSVVSWVNDFAGLPASRERYEGALKEVLEQREALARAEGTLTTEDRFRNLQYLNAELDAIRRNAVSRVTSEMAISHSPEIVARTHQLEAEVSRQSILMNALAPEQADLRRASQETLEGLTRELEMLKSGNLAAIKSSASASTIQHVHRLQDTVYKNQIEAIQDQISAWNSKTVVSVEEKAAKVVEAKVRLMSKIKLKRVQFGRFAGRLGIRALEVAGLTVSVIDIAGRIYISQSLQADPTLSPTFTYLKAKLNK